MLKQISLLNMELSNQKLHLLEELFYFPKKLGITNENSSGFIADLSVRDEANLIDGWR